MFIPELHTFTSEINDNNFVNFLNFVYSNYQNFDDIDWSYFIHAIPLIEGFVKSHHQFFMSIQDIIKLTAEFPKEGLDFTTAVRFSILSDMIIDLEMELNNA